MPLQARERPLHHLRRLRGVARADKDNFDRRAVNQLSVSIRRRFCCQGACLCSSAVFLERRRILCRHRIFKSGCLRNFGMFLIV